MVVESLHNCHSRGLWASVGSLSTKLLTAASVADVLGSNLCSNFAFIENANTPITVIMKTAIKTLLVQDRLVIICLLYHISFRKLLRAVVEVISTSLQDGRFML